MDRDRVFGALRATSLTAACGGTSDEASDEKTCGEHGCGADGSDG